MRWFGPAPFARVCEVTSKCETPVGDRCQQCHKTIKDGDQGFELPLANLAGTIETEVYYHQACLLRNMGIYAH